MTEIRFYHLERSTLELTLPVLLERVLERGQKALVVLGSRERVEALNAHLWTFRTESFIPHGTAGEGRPERQPVLLSTEDTNANGAEVLFLADGAVSGRVGAFKQCVELFDGRNEDTVAAARARWQDYKTAGHDLTYWKQTDKGWEKQG